MSSPEPIDVWLVEDNASFRRTLRRALEEDDGLRCGEEFGSCEAALDALAGAPAPDVVLLDVGLPGMSGIDALPRFEELAPTAKIIVLTVYEDDDKIFRALCAGAVGYLLKTASLDRIGEAVREVMDGGAPMNPKIARRVLNLFSRFSRHGKSYGLTEREQQILELLVGGLIKKEIADKLSISFYTVDTHLRSIYHKLRVTTRQAAVARALKEGLV
jgi:DNA-binding NarL/FixJ family response regulator